MVLDDIANCAGLVIERAPALYAETFRHRDLHAVNKVTIPEGLHEGVGEAEDHHVMDRPLAEIVIDAED